MSQDYITRDDFGDRFFAFNGKKEQNDIVNFSEITPFGAVNTFRAKYDTFEYVLYFLAERQRFFWTVLHFFLAKSAIAKICAFERTFYYVQKPCYCCVTWYERDSYSFFRFLILTWGDVFVVQSFCT